MKGKELILGYLHVEHETRRLAAVAMSDNLHDCDINPPHLPEYHDKVVKALEASDTPHVLFRWMLTNPEEVK